MTDLGAFVYITFFGVAALWLYLSGRGPVRGADEAEDQFQRPEDSNSASFAADVEESNPWLLSHSASK
ncbi:MULTISPECIES: hypothetical protein [Mycobacteriaceae]|uniref:hypothetical protein n=1 Tax=Mycobacteriaceae TaxID=1762 RepID=UPI00056A7E25|nr:MULTISPECIES: hypothetical protein [Mycobacteriaceae]AMO07864.1 hypothetical protein MyAD_24935 [Mycolicibacterium neoaurum]AXK77971.1 hypothetical protein DXK33_25570 [Mycolicibacterium neoaurum]KJQ49693.1 hypothetical protein TS71_14995 [Mycolicibacterium neoaurum]KUM07192.1 hypothetical protein AVZ31_17555 [Mycolicibacterium neoaurum]MDO3399776.1 hypothetical protein [Mycolicibacterium neoaurum]